MRLPISVTSSEQVIVTSDRLGGPPGDMRSHPLRSDLPAVIVAAALAVVAGWTAATRPLMGAALALVGSLLLVRAQGREGTDARVGSTILFGATVIALAPIDIIDLSGGSLGFNLTPWLVVSVPYAFALLLRRERAGAEESGKSPSDGRGLAAGLIALAVVSLFFLWVDPWGVAFKRLILTSWLVAFPFIFFSRNRRDAREMIVRGAKAFLVIDTITVVVEALTFHGMLKIPSIVGHYLSLAPVYVGDQIRFNGLVADPNRAAVDIVLMLGVAHFAATGTRAGLKTMGRWPYVLGLFLVALTYSRTGLAAALLLGLILALKSDARFRVYLSVILGLVLVVLSYVALSRPDYTVKVEDAFSNTQRQYATATHFGLMQTGYAVVTQSVKPFLIGVGWGTEYFYTYGFFPADKNGNFHSGFVSVAVNAGVPALLLYIALVLRPLVRRFPWGVLVLVIVWANIFYQSLAEPIYWMMLIALNSPAIQSPRPNEAVAEPDAAYTLRGVAIQEAL